MKRRVLSLLLCLVFCISLIPVSTLADGDRYLEINEANFPDAEFRKWVIDNLAGGKDYMTQAEVGSITKIVLYDLRISTLTGIERFPALSMLNCSNNDLTALDVSKNTALKGLNCNSNKLTTLDVSGCTALMDLYCYDNQLTALDVSKNTALEKLNCNGNKLTTLDVSQNTALKDLSCQVNQLTALDVSHNTALEDLICDQNQLTTLDVSQNTALKDLTCQVNQLTALDVSQNTALVQLWCSNNQLTALDVSHNTALEYLSFGNNQLTTLDVSQNTALKDLSCAQNQLTTLDVSHNTALKWLNCRDNQLSTLNMSKSMVLMELYCENNRLTTLDVSHNTALKWFDCSNNRLTTLDVSQNTKLFDLCCQDNHLSTLDLSANVDLRNLEMAQTIPDQKLAFANGKYQYDLSQLVPLGSIAKVTISGDGQLDKATGKVIFAKKVDSFTYQYATGRGAMDVTVHFTEVEDPVMPPTITTQPKDVNVKDGEQATFTVKATGEGNIEYQWYSRPNAKADWALVDGARANSYTVTGTKDNDGWQFRCCAKNEGGEVYSDAATLTVAVHEHTPPRPPKAATTRWSTAPAATRS